MAKLNSAESNESNGQLDPLFLQPDPFAPPQCLSQIDVCDVKTAWGYSRWTSSDLSLCRTISSCRPTPARRSASCQGQHAGIATFIGTLRTCLLLVMLCWPPLAWRRSGADVGRGRGPGISWTFQETSFLCDSADLSALRKQLGDEGSDDDSGRAAVATNNYNALKS